MNDCDRVIVSHDGVWAELANGKIVRLKEIESCDKCGGLHEVSE